MRRRRPAIPSRGVAFSTITDEPLARLLPALMRARGLTYRALATRTVEPDPQRRGVTAGHLANLVSGRSQPSIAVLRLLAEALEVEPESFVEYRLATLRRELDERAVGLDAAWRRYGELTD